MQSNHPNTNAEGYADPTATDAVNNISAREQAISMLIKGIKLIFSAFGLVLMERMVLKDKTTGRIYR